MRLAFDASILGRAQLLPVARSGIYRYADSLLQALAATGRCDLSLTSFGYSLDAAGITDYLADRESLRNLPVLLNPAIRVVGNDSSSAAGDRGTSCRNTIRIAHAR